MFTDFISVFVFALNRVLCISPLSSSSMQLWKSMRQFNLFWRRFQIKCCWFVNRSHSSWYIVIVRYSHRKVLSYSLKHRGKCSIPIRFNTYQMLVGFVNAECSCGNQGSCNITDTRALMAIFTSRHVYIASLTVLSTQQTNVQFI